MEHNPIGRFLYLVAFPFALFTVSDLVFHIPFKERFAKNLALSLLVGITIQLALYWPDPGMNILCFLFGYLGAGTQQLIQIHKGTRKKTDPFFGYFAGIAAMALIHYLRPYLGLP